MHTQKTNVNGKPTHTCWVYMWRDKLTITLRLLAVGSSYDLAVFFDVTYNYCNKIM